MNHTHCKSSEYSYSIDAKKLRATEKPNLNYQLA